MLEHLETKWDYNENPPGSLAVPPANLLGVELDKCFGPCLCYGNGKVVTTPVRWEDTLQLPAEQVSLEGFVKVASRKNDAVLVGPLGHEAFDVIADEIRANRRAWLVVNATAVPAQKPTRFPGSVPFWPKLLVRQERIGNAAFLAPAARS
jgi:hypothetical protein